MSSVFEMICRKVVQELSPTKDLIPLKNLLDADKFHCCSLLYKSKGSFPFFKPQFWEAGFTVDDLLEDSDELDCVSKGVKEKKNYRIEDNVEMNMNIALNVPQVISLNGEANSSTMCDLKLKSSKISQEGKESLVHRKLKKNQPSLFETLKKKGKNLYMVVETVEMVEEQKVQRKYSTDTSFQSLMWKIKGRINVNSAVTVPSESVLAFKTNVLVFDETCCRISHFNDENSFQSETVTASRSGVQTEESSKPLENFDDLQENVKDLNWELQDLAYQKDVLDLLIRHLQDGILRKLEEKVILAHLTEELSDPKNPLLNILFDDFGNFMTSKGDAMLYFLEALSELNELQQKLLAIVVEEGLLSELRNLVECILKQTSKSEPEPLFPKNDLIIHLVSLCDPEHKLNHSVLWNSETSHSLCALYSALSFLLLLAQGSSAFL
ncbi:gasdermin-B [Macrotis lagotis]|uniref:gasdermin-B n=1 Tax=Macrotis lagotis TaxID=92651 RepID=UPI003D690540